MKIYIAAPYATRDHLAPYVRQLRNDGHEIVSSWLKADHEITPGTLEAAPDLSDEYAMAHALKDIEEVKSADLLIFVTWDMAQGLVEYLGGNSGGRHVETGVALAMDIPVMVWGRPENIFHRGICGGFEDWHQMLSFINNHMEP